MVAIWLSLMGGLALLAFQRWQQADKALEQSRLDLLQARKTHAEMLSKRQLALSIASQAEKWPRQIDHTDFLVQLKKLQISLRIPALSAEFFSPAQSAIQTPRWHTEGLRLQLHLLHEEDLLRLGAALQAQHAAPIAWRKCSLSEASQQTLLARCELALPFVATGKAGQP